MLRSNSKSLGNHEEEKEKLRREGFAEKEGFKPGMKDTIRYDTRCYFNVRSKADISQLNLPHGTDN